MNTRTNAKSDYYYSTQDYTGGSNSIIDLYRQVLAWTVLTIVVCGLSAMLIGPMVPRSMTPMISMIVLGALLVTAFARKLAEKFAKPLAILVPAALGVTVYGAVEHYISSGMGSVVVNALMGTAVIFGTMAVFGWTSKKDMLSWGRTMFFILLGVIAVSLFNFFVLHSTGLSLVISAAAIVIFSIYVMIDLQAVKRAAYGNRPEVYALNIFLDLFNLFVSLLNILGLLVEIEETLTIE